MPPLSLILESASFATLDAVYITLFLLALSYEALAERSGMPLVYYHGGRQSTLPARHTTIIIEPPPPPPLPPIDGQAQPQPQLQPQPQPQATTTVTRQHRDFGYYGRRWGLAASLSCLPWSLDLHHALGVIPNPYNQMLTIVSETLYLCVVSVLIYLSTRNVCRGMRYPMPPHLFAILCGLPALFWASGWTCTLVSFILDRAAYTRLNSVINAAIFIAYEILLFLTYAALLSQLQRAQNTVLSIQAKTTKSTAGTNPQAQADLAANPAEGEPVSTTTGLIDLNAAASAMTRLHQLVWTMAICGSIVAAAFLYDGISGLTSSDTPWNTPVPPPATSFVQVYVQFMQDLAGWCLMGILLWFCMPKPPQQLQQQQQHVTLPHTMDPPEAAAVPLPAPEVIPSDGSPLTFVPPGQPTTTAMPAGLVRPPKHGRPPSVDFFPFSRLPSAGLQPQPSTVAVVPPPIPIVSNNGSRLPRRVGRGVDGIVSSVNYSTSSFLTASSLFIPGRPTTIKRPIPADANGTPLFERLNLGQPLPPSRSTSSSSGSPSAPLPSQPVQQQQQQQQSLQPAVEDSHHSKNWPSHPPSHPISMPPHVPPPHVPFCQELE